MYGARIRLSGRVGLNVIKRGMELDGKRFSQFEQGRLDGLDELSLIYGRKDRCNSPSVSHSAGSSKFMVASRRIRLVARSSVVLTVIIFSEDSSPGGK